MKKLSKELKEQISCKVDIKYCRDTDGHKDIEKVRQACSKYNLNIAIFDGYRYCYDNYRELNVSGELSLKEAEQLQKDVNLNVTIYYSHSQFTASYDNTYC